MFFSAKENQYFESYVVLKPFLSSRPSIRRKSKSQTCFHSFASAQIIIARNTFNRLHSRAGRMPSQTRATPSDTHTAAAAQWSPTPNWEVRALPRTWLLLHARLKRCNCRVTDLSVTVVLVKALIVHSQANLQHSTLLRRHCLWPDEWAYFFFFFTPINHALIKFASGPC